MRSIAQRISEHHKISVDDLKGASRLRPLAHARQHAMAEMRDAGFSTTQIGRFLGGRDHTTVVLGSARHRERAGLSA